MGAAGASSVITASAQVNVSAGTTSFNLSAVTFSNSNNVSFGMGAAGASSVITASHAINVSAGTTSFNVASLTLSNSNGLSFGMGAAGASSVITAAYGGFSSWSNGAPVTSFASSNAFFSLQPIVVPYNMTVSNVVWLASFSSLAAGATSGTFTFSAALYTLSTNAAGGTLSQASSGSTSLSWATNAPFGSNAGINYMSMTVGSWSLTPGPYALGFVGNSGGAGILTFYGNMTTLSILSNLGSNLTNQVFPGISVSSIAALPASIGVTNTASYVRTGSQAYNQPWILFQGT
jgi:hypothetical protein